MKLPNGYGSVYKLSGKRRNPWCARLTVGWTFDQLKMNHLPHDTRHTTVSLLTKEKVDDRIVKQIVGHKGTGVTQQVYTHIDLQTKLQAINKI